MSIRKVTVVGGGSTYSPEFVDGFIQHRDDVTVGEKIAVRDYYRTDTHFPPRNDLAMGNPAIIVQDGIVLMNYGGDIERVFFTQVNSFGLYFYKQPLKRSATEDGKVLLSAGELFTRIDEFIDSAVELYEEFGYRGNLDLGAADV